ncbi:IucA/IucC family protein [Piscinibacter sp.]|uniref:IucA/IucC family protein n=1 Tax=Piscinibacter sp. TaxID=1903157 RepID=UPI002CEC9E2C|nr:IucA/IucC family siderophore biosynthesis protein [Albitalea sp.]HUG25899.1 IucA/IucC family siderophore biosynthesis protein [Albitalea sp.]
MNLPRCFEDPATAVTHLDRAVWAKVNRALVRKAIAEFAHELVLQPVRIGASPQRAGWSRYRLDAPGGIEYRFEAQTMALRHWRIDEASIAKAAAGAAQPLDALQLVIEFKDALGIKPELLPTYLDEISSTLYGAAFKRMKHKLSSAELADADYQAVESAMAEGHPCFVANTGRLGFDAADYHAYAPEAGSSFRLVWLAVHKEQAHFACVSDLSYEQLVAEEVGTHNAARFRRELVDAGLPADDYLFMPAHPWQWFNKLSIAFAADVANRRIVCLGYSEDRYVAQQSIRTYFNADRHNKRYVKTSLSILNMGFMRGLSPYYMAGTPAINEWIARLVDRDATLRACGFSILREVASVGFRNRYYEAALASDSPFKKMLSCLWRDSPVEQLATGERLMTMAALLHVDRDGAALLPELIRRSGLAVDEWLRRYLRAYLAPLLHCFYAHDLSFMPHGENLIMVLQGHVPVRLIMKDIAEEAAILNKDAELPAAVQRLAADVPEDYKLLAIFIDVFDGFFRHLSQLLLDHGCFGEEDEFWTLVADCAAEYQNAHPQLRDKFARHDLFAPEFLHSCLNRLQLANTLQMVNLADPAGSLRMAGCLPNPIAKFRKRRSAATPAVALEPAA